MEQIFPGLSHAPNIHPFFVHFPIAFWLGAVLLYVLGSLRKHEGLLAAGRWLLYLGTLAAVFAVASGLWAEDAMGHDSPGHEFVHIHRNFMLVASAIAVVTTLVAFALRKRETAGARWTITALLLALAGVTTLGADRGAELVFRYGMGTASEAPSPAEEPHHHEAPPPAEETDQHEAPSPADETLPPSDKTTTPVDEPHQHETPHPPDETPPPANEPHQHGDPQHSH